MPTAEAPFLNAAEQPVLLSPNGARMARFELGSQGMMLRVEAAPAFGPQDSTSAVATKRDVIERVVIIPQKELGTKGVRDLFWLDDRVFLITGFDGFNGRFYGWIADLRTEQAKAISMPSSESSLFVPTGVDGLPTMRRDEKGAPELLLGFTVEGVGGAPARTWSWYSVSSGDLVDAAVSEELPTRLWREAVVSQLGQIEALLLVNGSVHRRTPDGWLGLGTVALAAAEGEAAPLGGQTLSPRQHLVSAGPDYSVFAVDTLGPGSGAPLATPPLQDLVVAANQESDLPSSEADVPAWVLLESRERQTAALVHMTAVEGAAPTPLFAHPFADVFLFGVWVDPATDCPEAVAVEDIQPRTYALRPRSGQLLAELRRQLPPEVQLGEVSLPTEDMEPVTASRHGDRWVVLYKHPAMAEWLALPVLVRDGSVQWIGKTALPARGGALSAVAATMQPRVEGHRLRAPHEGAHDVPVYLMLPEEDPSALVLRVHEGPMRRVGWGADSLDAWLLSRGYGVLKVNHRGSSGFGRRWSALVPGEDTEGGFLDDMVLAVRWALEERKALPGSGLGTEGTPPPVAILGSYFGGYAALQAMLNHHGSLFACGIAVAPTQALPKWPDSYIPNAEERSAVQALRAKEGWAADGPQDGADPASAALAPSARAGELRELPLLVVEFERDGEDAKGELLQRLAPAASDHADWPSALSFVRYAGEGRGGGVVRQSGLDQYRRIDAFLHAHLGPLAAEGRPPPLREPFVDELPFLSAALLPETSGDLSSSTLSIERGFEDRYQQLDPDKAAAFPNLHAAPTKASGRGFGRGGSSEAKVGKREALVAPRSRLAVREDGTIEVHVVFGEEPEGLHVLLSEVWLHIRAKGLGFTMFLPRQPLRHKVGVSRLPGVGSFVFEVAADPDVGALENYNQWAAGGYKATIMSSLGPEDIAAAPMEVAAGVEVLEG